MFWYWAGYIALAGIAYFHYKQENFWRERALDLEEQLVDLQLVKHIKSDPKLKNVFLNQN